MIIKRLLVLFVFTLNIASANAAPITWDFESLHGTGLAGPAFESFGQEIEDTNSGFKLTTTAVFGGFISYNPGGALYGSSVELIANTIGRTTTLSKSDSSSFSILSIDLGFSNLAQLGNGDLTFDGVKSDNSLIQQTFSINSVLTGYSFSAGFSDLVSLTWLQTSQAGHRFDNINVDGNVNVASTPEPMILSLLAFGLIGLGARKKRSI